MPVFRGFDTSIYPGDDKMLLLRTEADVAWTGFYLGPAPSHPDDSWMSKRDDLSAMGFGFAPLYVGQQQPNGKGSHILTPEQGALDGADAAQLARDAGFPSATIIYLDIETGPPILPEFVDYYKAWVDAVSQTEFLPGLYCSHLLATELRAADNRPVLWVFRLLFSNGHKFSPPLPAPDPFTESAVPGARVLQYAQNGSVHIQHAVIAPADLDTALSPDPSVKPV